MLKLVNVKKEYISGNKYSKKYPINKVDALKGVSLEFRDSEFVAILGPSGCGKTTLLNVIGGLDKYTGGDLYIDNKSTKNFSDYEWDTYRNGQIGFVFQNYNLIMHQNVLANVEMALTLIGLSREEKRKRAIAALESVGLGDQIYKKPNQLSGGQMQRVAIARAIINNPKIILADEPTGALDTESSLQVMKILKELSKERLIIVVTHNTELANEYATRIVRLVDGKIVSDSNPYESNFVEDKELPDDSRNPFTKFLRTIRLKKKAHITKTKPPHMTYTSAFKLSLSNLATKKTRTILTSFAGSIGIIGIALILAISSGFQGYIGGIEESALSRYPLTIQKTNFSLPSMFNILTTMNKIDRQEYPESEEAYVGKVMAGLLQNMFNAFQENDLANFKEYVDQNFDSSYASVKYNYSTTLNIYSNYIHPDTGEYIKINPFDDLMGDYLGWINMIDPEGNFMKQIKQMVDTMTIWEELISNQKLLEEQYDLLGQEYGSRWPTAKDEIVLVLDKYNQITDYTLFAIGIENPDNLMTLVNKETAKTITGKTYDFSELLSLKYRVMTNADYYYQDEYGNWFQHDFKDPSTGKRQNLVTKEYIEANSLELKVVGIVRPNEKCISPSINGTIGYTRALSEYLISHAAEHPAVLAQQASPTQKITDPSVTLNEKDLESVLIAMGKADLSKPLSISFFVTSFEAKDEVIAFINQYNATHEDNIKYTDTLGAMMSSVNEISNAITRVLIAFSAISLIVSSIMIGIITYISVLERTKEIGILRSLGARKKDISRVFNSETISVGFIAGVIGVGITYLLTVPINYLLESKLGIKGIAHFVWWHALILIAISIVLTLFAGFIPSRMAAKKDPVKALRSE